MLVRVAELSASSTTVEPLSVMATSVSGMPLTVSLTVHAKSKTTSPAAWLDVTLYQSL